MSMCMTPNNYKWHLKMCVSPFFVFLMWFVPWILIRMKRLWCLHSRDTFTLNQLLFFFHFSIITLMQSVSVNVCLCGFRIISGFDFSKWWVTSHRQWSEWGNTPTTPSTLSSRHCKEKIIFSMRTFDSFSSKNKQTNKDLLKTGQMYLLRKTVWDIIVCFDITSLKYKHVCLN